MQVCSLIWSKPLNCTHAMENHMPGIVECIRISTKMTQEEKNQWHVHMFIVLWDSVSTFNKGEKKKPYNILFEGISFLHRVIDGQYPSNSEQLFYFSLHKVTGGSPVGPVLQELGALLMLSGLDWVSCLSFMVHMQLGYEKDKEIHHLYCSVSPPFCSLSGHSNRAQGMSMKDGNFCSKGHHGFNPLVLALSQTLWGMSYLCSQMLLVPKWETIRTLKPSLYCAQEICGEIAVPQAYVSRVIYQQKQRIAFFVI